MKYVMLIGLLLYCCASCIADDSFANLADPTAPFNKKVLTQGKVKRVSRLDLHAIYISPSDRHAMINGKVVREQEWINDVKIIRILNNEIIISRRGSTKLVSIAMSKFTRTPQRAGVR